MTSARRTFLWLAAIAPVAASQWTRPALAQASAGQFVPGAVACRLTRTVVRQLGRAGKLTVTREWSVRFATAGRGYRVTGEQAGVTVDAPPVLADLARIERERVEDSMFPLMLDPAGRMMDDAAVSAEAALADAVQDVRRRLADRAVSGRDLAEAERFLEALQAAGQGTVAAWPRDLFAPGARSTTESQTVALPGGATGTVTVTTETTSDRASGLMERFERRVETRIGTQSRLGTETFILTPQA